MNQEEIDELRRAIIELGDDGSEEAFNELMALFAEKPKREK